MNTLRRLPSFDDDLISIWCRIAVHNPLAADRLIDRIDERCRMLRDHPKAGPARPDIAADCRHLVVGPVLVLYRHMDSVVELVRAVDGRRDIGPEMFGG